MKKITIVLFVFLLSTHSFAALPPEHQNARDFRVITSFVLQHKKVMSSLKSIDFKKFVVYFGDECEAKFGRKARAPSSPSKPRPVGPAAPLEFKSATCSLDWPST